MTDFKDRKKRPTITAMPDLGKPWPAAEDLECAIIGALLIDPQAYTRISYLLDVPEKMYKEAHQKILEVIIYLHDKKIGIDPLTVTSRLRDTNQLDAVGGPVYIMQLTGKIVSAAHVEFHSMIITDKYLLRELIRIGHEIQNRAFDDSNDPSDIAQWAEEELMTKFDLDIEGRATFKDALHSTILDMTNKAKGIVSAFIRTGDSEIDEKISLRVRQCMLIAGAEGTGKCFGYDTPILMFDHSIKMIQDIKVGDLLMGPDGTSRTVKSLGSSESKLYKVNQQKGISYIVNEGHILSTKFIGRVYQNKKTKEKSKRGYGNIINLPIEDFISKSNNWKYLHKGYKGISSEFDIPVKIPPYLLGLWLGDGSKSYPQITNMDKEIETYLRYNFKTKEVTGKRKGDCKSYYLSGLRNDFNYYNLLYNKHIPLDYLRNIRQVKLELLAGLLDTDGSMNKLSHRNLNKTHKSLTYTYEITQKNEQLANDIETLCISLGFYVKKTEKIATIKRINYSCKVYRLYITGNKLYEIPCKIIYKQSNNSGRIYDPTLSVLNIENHGYGKYYGITVDKDELFMLEDYTVVHNTKYVAYITKGILDNNENVRVLWFSMEDSKEQIIRSFIAMGAKITTKQMQSINYTLTEKDWESINGAIEQFEDYNIEFVDRVCSISTIMRKARNYREKHKDCILIIIVDNLGLIETESFYRGTEKDDYLAGRLKETSDITDASMFILHHITKESKSKLNINEGYRPRSEYIKGSTRILDYVQQAVMVNLPRKYKDLVAEEKIKADMFNSKEVKGKFTVERFKTEFWTINPKGDKNTKGITDLFMSTWNELKTTCAMETLDDGMPITVGYLLRKYIEYSVSIDEVNRNRKAEYHSGKVSIYIFLNNKMYKEDYKPQASSRTFYLYGNDISRAKYIQSLFIVESIKNRDGSDIDDQNIIRYNSNLDYNIFIPMTDAGWEELKNIKKDGSS